MKQTLTYTAIRTIVPTLAGFLGAAVAMFFNEAFVAFCNGGAF